MSSLHDAPTRRRIGNRSVTPWCESRAALGSDLATGEGVPLRHEGPVLVHRTCYVFPMSTSLAAAATPPRPMAPCPKTSRAPPTIGRWRSSDDD